MNAKTIFCLALVLTGGWFGSSIAAHGSDAVVAVDQRPGAEQFFKDYLAKCGTNEVRCLWFLDDKSNVGMVMTINLGDYTVFTAREVYNWAEQASDTRKLSHPQLLTLKQIVKDLPGSDKNVEFGRSIFVAIRKDNQAEIFQYDRRHPPPVVQRIYDLGGGYFYDGSEAFKVPGFSISATSDPAGEEWWMSGTKPLALSRYALTNETVTQPIRITILRYASPAQAKKAFEMSWRGRPAAPEDTKVSHWDAAHKWNQQPLSRVDICLLKGTYVVGVYDLPSDLSAEKRDSVLDALADYISKSE